MGANLNPGNLGRTGGSRTRLWNINLEDKVSNCKMGPGGWGLVTQGWEREAGVPFVLKRVSDLAARYDL